jgi:B12-binding domain/radical SAM domain protein of rhizo-twelve system
MKLVLINPPWTFDGSIYFGCREPHLPLELGYARLLLQQQGHDVLMLDGHLLGLDEAGIAKRTLSFGPDLAVVTTAPSYLFWRCAPPELTVPRRIVRALTDSGIRTIAIGPHGSVTPGPVLHKLGASVVLRGEPEEALVELADTGSPEAVQGAAWLEDGHLRINGGPRMAAFTDMPPLPWPDDWIARHHHHHHRFDCEPDAPGAEVEASRGCPYSCSFCAKIDYRDRYRRRRLDLLLTEIDGLVAQGVRYIYFIDEIFLPWRQLLEQLRQRPISFGIQTRIDLWKPEMLDLLGEAGCVSVEAGVESLTEQGRAALDKECRLGTDQLTALLIHARRSISFVQANLIGSPEDDPETIAAWRAHLQDHGVWANDPVPLFPYPSSPDYRKLWGKPDDYAWERAHAYYLKQFARFSDIQETRPLPLPELEAAD